MNLQSGMSGSPIVFARVIADVAEEIRTYEARLRKALEDLRK